MTPSSIGVARYHTIIHRVKGHQRGDMMKKWFDDGIIWHCAPCVSLSLFHRKRSPHATQRLYIDIHNDLALPNVMFPWASQPDLVRSAEKDEFYCNLVREELQELVSVCLGEVFSIILRLATPCEIVDWFLI